MGSRLWAVMVRLWAGIRMAGGRRLFLVLRLRAVVLIIGLKRRLVLAVVQLAVVLLGRLLLRLRRRMLLFLLLAGRKVVLNLLAKWRRCHQRRILAVPGA